MRTVQIKNYYKATINDINKLTNHLEPKIVTAIKNNLDNMENLASDFYGSYVKKLSNGDVAILGNAAVYRGAAHPILVNRLMVFRKNGDIKEKFSILDKYNENKSVKITKSIIIDNIKKFSQTITKHLKKPFGKTDFELYAYEKNINTPGGKNEYLWVKNSLDGRTIEDSYGSLSKSSKNFVKKVLPDGSREYIYTENL